MNEQIRIGVEEENPSFFQFVRIKSIKTVHNLDSIAEHFSRELKTIALEELLQVDASVKMVMQVIQKLRPNMVVLNKDNSFICIDTEVMVGQCIAIRNGKLIATGTYDQMQEAVCIKIQKEWSGKFDNLNSDEIDEDWLKNFCAIHYKKEHMYKIVKL